MADGQEAGLVPAEQHQEAAEETGVTLLTHELECSICLQLLTDPFVTGCGHTFCYGCITKQLQMKAVCPCCSAYLTADRLYPNFLLHKVAQRAAKAARVARAAPAQRLQAAFREQLPSLPLQELDALLGLLSERKHSLEQAQAEANLELLLHFLKHSRFEKAEKLQQLQTELLLLESDIRHVAAQHPAAARSAGAPSSSHPPAQQLAAAGQQQPPAGAQTAGRRQQGPDLRHAAFGSLQPLAMPDQAAPAAARPGGTGGARQHQPAAMQAPAVKVEAGAEGMPAASSLARAAPPAMPDRRQGSSHHLERQQQEAYRQAPPQTSGAAANGHQGPLQQGWQGLNHAWQQAASPGGQGSPRMLTMPPVHESPAGGWPRPSGSTAAGRQPGRELDQEMQDAEVAMAAGPAPPLPTRLPAGAAVHMHPRHLAFQAFDQQLQAAAVQHVQPGSSGDTGHTAAGSGTSHSELTAGSDASHAASAGSEHVHRAKRRHVMSQFEDLQQCYLRLRRQQQQQQQRGLQPDVHLAANVSKFDRLKGQDSAGHAASLPADGLTPDAHENGLARQASEQSRDSMQAMAGAAAAPQPHARGDTLLADHGLTEFSRVLSIFSRCSRLQPIAQLPRASNRQNSSILSSIEFDRDSRLFATAGVSKRISVFDYATVMDNPHAVTHCPTLEIQMRSKLSCLSWNPYVRSHLACSNYEGVLQVWDVATSQSVVEYEAHEKRIWSAHFCTVNPSLLVTGSDDGWVKVWSTKQATSVAELNMRANVCCVNYSPCSPHEVAVGSADHRIHLYDLRHAAQPLHVFDGHRKAVSYVRYLNARELVSASTDSTLRMWDVSSHTPARTYSGHANEKNFVGLSVDGEFIACGSETNEVFVYYKAMSKPMARRLFCQPGDVQQAQAQQQDPHQFISAVCWKPGASVLLAANSQGTIQVLQLTS